MKPLLIVDGYNVIGAWREAERHNWTLDESRDQLQRRLEEYSGYSGEEIVLVFDGYRSDRKTATEEVYGVLKLVFTKQGETADSYIERLVAQVPRYRQVRVATSDGLEQSQVLSTGATRLTSRELLLEMQQARSNGMKAHQQQSARRKSSIASRVGDKTLEALERMRRG